MNPPAGGEPEALMPIVEKLIFCLATVARAVFGLLQSMLAAADHAVAYRCLPSNNRRILAYVRVASQEQGQPSSMERQADCCALYAHRFGLSVTRIFQDRGVSGMTLERPGLKALMDAIRPGDVVVVEDLDRLSRRLPDVIVVHKAMRDRGVELHSALQGVIKVVQLALNSLMHERTRVAFDRRRRSSQAEVRRSERHGRRSPIAPKKVSLWRSR